jgi:hypothetical protein
LSAALKRESEWREEKVHPHKKVTAVKITAVLVLGQTDKNISLKR